MWRLRGYILGTTQRRRAEPYGSGLEEAKAMSSSSQPPKHWPFDQDPGAGGAHDSKEASLARERARQSQASLKGHMRHDRLIVGGRAHVRKQGLS